MSYPDKARKNSARTLREKSATSRDLILTTAIELAHGKSYVTITRREIAHQAGISEALINHHFGNMVAFRRKLVAAAIASDHYHVIGQAVLNKEPLALKIVDATKRRALAALTQ